MTNVPLTDSRFTAIAADALDGSVVSKLPAPTLVQAGITMRRSGNIALFNVGALPNGTPIEIPVVIENEQAVFFPERDAGHKQIMTLLGIDG